MSHGEPGGECMICMEDIDKETYCEYKCCEGGPWKPALVCTECLQRLIDSQFETYTTQLATTKCKAEQRRLLTRGPPINVGDRHALPCDDDGEVQALWYAVDNTERSPKLKGSLVGEERMKWWEEQKKFFIVEGDTDPDVPVPEAGTH